MRFQKMPVIWSRRWRKLWFSGAIPYDVVFFNKLADELQRYKNEGDKSPEQAYFHNNDSMDDVSLVRSGSRLPAFSRGLMDLAARVSQDLRLPWKAYLRLTEQLFGKPSPEIERTRSLYLQGHS